MFARPNHDIRLSRCLLPLAILCLSITSVAAQTTTWTGGGPSNNWNDVLNWDNGVPGVNSLVVVPDGFAPTLNVSPTIDSLDLGAESTLDVLGSGSLTITGGSLMNDGFLSLGDTNATSGALIFGTTNATLSGSGIVDIHGASADDTIDTVGVSLTNGTGHTISGSGFVQALLTNQGLVDANNSGRTLVLNDKDKTNTGTFRATGGGTLNISGIAVANVGAFLESAGGKMRIGDGATVTGGTISGGDVDFGTSTVNNVDFAPGTLSQLEGSQTLTFAGPNITNDGVLQLGATNATSGTLTIANSLTLDGGGEIDITGASADDNIDAVSGATLTQTATHTIRGSGFIQASLVNHGIVNADNSGRTLVLNDQDKTNNNLMTATMGGVLRLESFTLQNTGSDLLADGGRIDLAGATVIGGELTSTSGSSIHVNGSSTLENVALPTSDTLLIIDGNQTATFTGTSLLNNGRILLGATNATSGTLLFDGDIAINGTGEIDITGGSANDNIDTVGSSTITSSVGQKIRGSGTIQAALTSHGIIDADNSGSTLVLNDQDKTNTGTFRASGGGTLNISGIALANAGAFLESAGGKMRIGDGATVNGGTISGGDVDFGTSTVNNVDFAPGTLSQLEGNQTLTFAGPNITNDGVLQLGATNATSGTLTIANSLTLDGGGEIDITGASADDNIDAVSGATLTQAATHTIRGSGFIQASLINHGVVNADNSGRTLVLNDQDKTNNNLMTATSGGTLQISGVQVGNGSGLIDANGGKVIVSDDAQIVGGRIKSTGNVVESHTAKFTGVEFVAGSEVNLAGNHVMTIDGFGLRNDAIVKLGATNATSGIVVFDTTGDLSGDGEFDITGASTTDSVVVTLGNTMNHGVDHTIRGSGYVFGNIVNDGTMEADNSGRTLFLDPDGVPNGNFDPELTAKLVNNGTLRATTGGTLNLLGDGTGQFSNPGTIEAIGGTVTTVDAILPQLTSTVTAGTYRAIDGTINIAPSGYQPAINNAVIETSGTGNNDVLGVKTGSIHSNNALVENHGAILLDNGANLTLTVPSARGGPSHLVSTGDLLVGNDSTLDVAARATGFVFNTETVIAGLQVVGGTLRGSGTIAGGVYMPSGTLLPGDADGETGLLSIIGEFNMDDPNLLIEDALTVVELGGTIRGDEYDSFAATGDFFGQGVLEARLINGFLPSMGDEFVLATYVEDGDRIGNLWDTYQFNRVQFALDDRSTGGQNRETILTVLDVRDIDFDSDLDFDCADVDALVTEIVSGTNAAQFDLNFDGLVDDDDLNIWLTDAGALNLSSGQAYLPGDATLDGVVDGQDFLVWNLHKFSPGTGWCSGDFNANGTVDGSDFLIWNAFKFQSSGFETRPAAVPEPASGVLALGLLAALSLFVRRV